MLVHDDGFCANGERNTPLVNGCCPVCNIHPDMQSTAIMEPKPAPPIRSSILSLCVDTGTTLSGYCFWDSFTGLWGGPEYRGKATNDVILYLIMRGYYDHLVMEDITPQGIMGKTTIETIKWLGRFEQANSSNFRTHEYISRSAVKKHLTGKVNKIKDSHIRQAVISRIYPQYTLKDPGPLIGVKADIWSAVALGLTWSDSLVRRSE